MNNHPFIARTAESAQWCSSELLFSSLLKLLKIDGPSGSEQLIRGYLYKELESLGAESLRVDKTGNLHGAFRGGNTKGPSLLLTAHMDTVPAYSGKRKISITSEGILSESGKLNLGADDRGGIAMVLEAIRCSPCYLSNLQRLHVLFTVKEEVGWQGARAVAPGYLDLFDTVVSVDVPARSAPYNPHIAVCHCDRRDMLQVEAEESARRSGISPTVLNYQSGYIGGDASLFFTKGSKVIDFCSGAVRAHTPSEWCSFPDMVKNTDWLIQFLCNISAKDKDFFLYDHPGKKKTVQAASTGITSLQFFARLKSLADSRGPEHLSGLFDDPGDENIFTGGTPLWNELSSIIGLADSAYSEDVSSALYRFLFNLYSKTSCMEKQTALAWFLLSRLRNRYPGMLELEKIITILFKKHYALVTGLISEQSWQSAGKKLLSPREKSFFDSHFPYPYQDMFKGWNGTRNYILAIIRRYRLNLNQQDALMFFVKSFQDSGIRRELFVLFTDSSLAYHQLLNFTSVDPESEKGDFFCRYFLKIYPQVSEDIKISIINWLGQLGGRRAILFLLQRFREQQKFHGFLLPWLLSNAGYIIPEILSFYREQPYRALPLLEHVPFSCSTLINEAEEVLSEAEHEAVLKTAERYRNIWYRNEPGRHTSAFLYLSLRLVIVLSHKYNFNEVMKYLILVDSISWKDKQYDLLTIFNRVNPLNKNYLLEFILHAETWELNMLKNQIANNASLTDLKELTLAFRKTQQYAIDDKSGRDHLYGFLKDQVCRIDFDRFCDSIKECQIPEPAWSLPPFLVHPDQHTGEMLSFSHKKRLSEMKPERTNSYEKIFAPILERAAGGKKLRKKIFHILREMPEPANSIDELKNLITTENPAKLISIIIMTGPVIIESWYKEKNHQLKDIVFRMFIEALYSQSAFNEIREDETILEEDYLSLLQHCLLDAENSIYGEYSKTLVGSCSSEYEKNFPGEENIFAPLETVSDLRHILKIKKAVFDSGNAKASRGLSTSTGNQAGFVNRQFQKLFLVEMFNRSLTGKNSDRVSGSHSLCFKPGKDVTLAFRSEIAGDCNVRNLEQVQDPSSLFYYIYYKGRWCGYASMVVITDKKTGARGLVIDVLNVRHVPRKTVVYVDRFIENLKDFCRANGFTCLLTAENIDQFSNYDYIRNAVKKYYSRDSIRLRWDFVCAADYQSINMSFNIKGRYNCIWHEEEDRAKEGEEVEKEKGEKAS